jgi:predicted dehydrogenase
MATRQIGVGVIGCGTISNIYLENLTKHFTNLRVLTCADIIREKAQSAKEKFNIPKFCTVEELLADPEIELVVNLTIPVSHHSINMQVLASGKHVYCEKPLALSLREANEAYELSKERRLLLASAPDTFLGAGIQTARKLIDDGLLGKLVGFTANMCSPGVELWHPAPDFYYKKGGGPLWDMGPYYLTALVVLLGPIKKISCITNSPRTEREGYGRKLPIEVSTHYAGIVEFQNGVVGNVNMSFDVWRSGLPLLEVYGTGGAMSVPDPNMFNGSLTYIDGSKVDETVRSVQGNHTDRLIKLIQNSQSMNKEFPLAFPAEEQPRSNMRGLGVSEMCSAIATGRPCRLNADISRHVVEALYAFDTSAIESKPYLMTTICERPALMPQNLPLWQID